jgi:hypothetical protein
MLLSQNKYHPKISNRSQYLHEYYDILRPLLNSSDEISEDLDEELSEDELDDVDVDEEEDNDNEDDNDDDNSDDDDDNETFDKWIRKNNYYVSERIDDVEHDDLPGQVRASSNENTDNEVHCVEDSIRTTEDELISSDGDQDEQNDTNDDKVVVGYEYDEDDEGEEEEEEEEEEEIC